MSSIDHASKIFHELRPLCVEIARDPTSCKIDALREYLQSHQSRNFTSLQEYIIFPLQSSIRRKNTSMDLKVRAINCICILLSQTGVTRFDIFQEIFQNVCLLLSSEEPGKLKAMSEDVKEVLVDCILTLLTSSSSDVLEDMYGKSFMPSVGHCISLLLCIAENEKAKQLRVKAIECIRKFVFVCKEDKSKGGSCFRRHEKLLSMKLASFLPGISISLGKIVTGGNNQGQKVIMGALEAWVHHIEVVMNDQYLPVECSSNSVDDVDDLISKLTLQKESKDVSKANRKQTPAERGLEIQKNKEWLSNTASKLKLLIERVVSLARHANWKVRLAVLQFSEVLLKNCCRSLASCVPCLVEIVIGFLSDEYSQISERSKEIMDELNMLLSANNDQASLIQVVEENLYALFSSLPRQIRSTEEEKKLHTLHVIVGYLHLLGYHIKTILSSGHLLKRLSHALVQVLEFDLSDVKIVEQKVLPSTGTRPLNNKHFGATQMTDSLKQLNTCQAIYKKCFKHFRNEKVLDAVIRICWYFGCYGDIMLLVDHFLDLFRSSTANRKQVAFLINQIILGVMGNPHCDGLVFKELPEEHLACLRTCVTLILAEYLSRQQWDVRISNDDEERLKSRKEDLLVLKPPISQSFSGLNSNIQLLCLLLEGIGIFATLLREHFDGMLQDVLYPVMEKLGSHNATVSEMAHWSLVAIAASCNYGSVEALIGGNVDYLINSISLNLRHISLNPDTPVVLSAMLQYGNKGLIPYMQDTLNEVLCLIDYSADEFLFSLVKVLNSLTVAVNRWFPAGKSATKLDESGKKKEKSIQNNKLKEFFISQLKLKKTSLGEVSDEDLETETESAADGTEHKEDVEDTASVKDVPQHIIFTEQVLEKCTHFMVSKFVKVRLVVLDTAEHGVLALAGSENRLLPMIHKLWRPMVKCFTDDELIVRTRAVSVLRTMVGTSGQFMRRRVIKEAFPALTSFLVKQQAVSLRAGAIYSHTQGFKCQFVILNTVCILCRDLDISGVECDGIVSCIAPYLNEKQPQELQQAAVYGLKVMIDLEPDLIWLSLNDLHCPSLPANSVFPAIQFASGSSETNEYAVNVVKLLKEYE